MTEQEILFFKKIEEESKKNPMVRVGAAADYLTGFLQKAFSDEKGTRVDTWSYFLSAVTGVSVAETAKDTDKEMMALNMGKAGYMPLTKIEGKGGTFWIGDPINKYMFNSPISVWNIVMTLYSQKHGKKDFLDLKTMIDKNAKMMGKKSVRIWNGERNPYEEIEDAKNTYGTLKEKLEPYKLTKEEYPSAFALSLANVIVKVEDVFPKKYNCLQMCMEAMMFF